MVRSQTVIDNPRSEMNRMSVLAITTRCLCGWLTEEISLGPVYTTRISAAGSVDCREKRKLACMESTCTKGLSTLTTAASATAAATMTSERFLVRASSAACTHPALILAVVRTLCKQTSLRAIGELPSLYNH